MSKAIDIKQKKQDFAINSLFPFFVTQVESMQGNNSDKKLITKRMAEMKIFPYITMTGTMYGSLSEPGISWYYCKDEKQGKTISTDSYRILDHKRFNQALFGKIKLYFGEYNLLREFSDEVVRNTLIEKMGNETNYSDLWWKYAIDAFKLWNKKEDLGTRLRGATQKINNSWFLFDDSYCEPEFRVLLENNHIYTDIRKTQGFKKYISSNPGEKEKDKIAFLEYLGVPSKFIKKEGYSVWSVDDRLSELFKNVGKRHFPISSPDVSGYNLCRLSEYVFEVIYTSDKFSAEKLMKQTDTLKGIVVRNINDDYISLQYSLFYAEDYSDHELEQSRINKLLIQSDRYYQDMLKLLAEDVKDIKDYETYNFGDLNIKRMDFYRWAWQFTDNKVLLDNILNYLTKLRNTEKKDQKFILNVLDHACGVEYDEYGEYIPRNIVVNIKRPFILNLEADSSSIIKHSHTLNALYKEFFHDINVSLRITDAQFWKKIPGVNEIKKRIMDEVGRIVPGKVTDIEKDKIWQTLYIFNDSYPTTDNYGIYVHLNKKDTTGGIQGPVVLLANHEDKGSYFKAISSYIADMYGIILGDLTIDWGKEYSALAQTVDEFISDRKGVIEDNYINSPFSYMDDVSTLKQELEIWNRLKNEKKMILRNHVSGEYFEDERVFLDKTYHGRCQLCGVRTITGKDRAHFWTYRIAKEKENGLANMDANLFCLCPTCHGALSYGFKGRDLTSIKIKAKEYVQQLEICIEEEPDDLETTESIISDFSDQVNDHGEFRKPIVCNVVVNGEPFRMKFSWEHFMQIAFLLSQAD